MSNSTFSGNSASHAAAASTTTGTLTVSNSTFSGNSATPAAASTTIRGTLTVSNSTFSDNSASHDGGGIYNGGTVTVSNSTFSGNSATYGGGGIGNYNTGPLTVSNSTFSGNSAAVAAASTTIRGTVTLKNTIVANSLTGDNCSGTITDGGGNLSYPDTTCPGINSDPLLGPLQNNGGPPRRWRLAQAARRLTRRTTPRAAAPVNNLDQRGIARPRGAL